MGHKLSKAVPKFKFVNKIRVIARLDIKNEFVIKGIHLEGLRKVGDPNDLAKKYYENGIDEIVFIDAVAAYYDRNSLSNIIRAACKHVFYHLVVQPPAIVSSYHIVSSYPCFVFLFVIFGFMLLVL